MSHPTFRAVVSAQFVAIIAALTCGSLVLAQPGRGPVPREARGTIKSIDASARTITIYAVEGGSSPVEKKFTLAKDAEIALGDGTLRRGVLTAGKLEDLAPGTQLTLTLAEGSEDSVVSLLAQGPQVRGPVKSVDTGKKEITVTVFAGGRDPGAEDQTFAVTDSTEIGIDDGRGRRFSIREGKLADVVAGAQVTLQLSPDRKSVQAIVAEGPTLQGIAKAVEPGKLTLAMNAQRPGEEPSEMTLDVAADALVTLDDGRGRRLSQTVGKLSDIPTGSLVRARLSGDQKQAVQITAEGPNQAGLVKSVDAAKRTITVALYANRGAEPEEKTLVVAPDARIVIDNKPAGLDEIKPVENGPFANLRLSLDQKSVQAITLVNR
jgi:hypothetical protein